MSDADSKGIRGRISERGEEALGELAQALLENPIFNNALQAAFGARERAQQAQRSAMGALNLPSAADLDRLTRRVRSISERLEAIEEGIDRLQGRDTEAGAAEPQGLESRLAAIEGRLDELARDVATLRKRLAAEESVSTDQERLSVSE